MKRLIVRNIVEAAAVRDLTDQCVFEGYQLPKLYIKMQYCISCAIHSHIVRVRSVEARKIRVHPRRPRFTGPSDRQGPRPGTATGAAGAKPSDTPAAPAEGAAAATPAAAPVVA